MSRLAQKPIQRIGKEVTSMDRVPVVSSNVASIGYDAATKTLEVGFNNGSVYQYLDVPASEHRAFMNAPSKGQFVHQRLKAYRYRRVR